MQIAIIGDIHFGASLAFGRPDPDTGINSRLLDYEKTLDDIITYIIESDIKLCIMLGDIFETRNPSQQQVVLFYRQLERLSKSNITTYVIMGNHDYIKTRKITSSLDLFKEVYLPNVFVFTDIALKIFSDGTETINVLLMPYRNRQSYDKTLNDDAIIELKKELAEAMKMRDDASSTLLCGHMMMEGTIPADAGDYGINELILPFDMFEGIDVIINGHIHRASILKENPLFIYSGSMECKDFSEKDHKKAFLIYDTAKTGIDAITFKHIQTRAFVDFNLDYSVNFPEDPIAEILAEVGKHQLQDSVVRFEVKVPETKLTAIDTTIVRKALYDVGVNYISDISVTPIISKQLRNQKIHDAPDDISAFKHYIDSQINLHDDVLKFGLNIIMNEIED